MVLLVLLGACDPAVRFTVVNPCKHALQVGLLTDDSEFEEARQGRFDDWNRLEAQSEKTWSALDMDSGGPYAISIRMNDGDDPMIVDAPEATATVPPSACAT